MRSAADDLEGYNADVDRLLRRPVRWKDEDDRSLGVTLDALHLTHEARNRGSCEAALVKLDPKLPLHGLDASRWGQLLRDADWLLENFIRQAALDGWSAADLFGLLPGHDGWGGVADRLRGSRSLVMTADLACWRRMLTQTRDSFARGASAMPKLVLMWDEAVTGGVARG